ncbi:SPFH domain-containing protein [Desulfoluna butyratoxydans]|uniref:Band 7 domain n=1 Tax=Desulfoluna butyratoxydans TaxID=231438 RepID=A0A4U8YM66_9BACT|nr:stomatin-like protein [Desulfoluna butyratoxydans]VFQ44780.1 band 7 domain [Desulfoluna butyratoxydans]
MDKILSLLTLWIVRFVFVKEGTNVVITRFGKYVKTLTPGMQSFVSLWGLLGNVYTFKITDPMTSNVISTNEVDIKEIVYDYPKERVISKDNVQFEVNAIIYFNVFDPYKALFKVTDYTSSLRKLVQSILRAEIGNHVLEETYSNRALISESLTQEADKATDEWGIRVVRLEIKEFELGAFAEQLLHQKQQDIEKRQQILHAEGLREAKIKEAEGQREYEITIADGKKVAAAAEAEAIIIKAKADADAKKMEFDAESYGYEVIAKVIQAHPDIAYYLKLHAGNTISKNLSEGKATKIFLPNSSEHLINSFSSISEALDAGKSTLKKDA